MTHRVRPVTSTLIEETAQAELMEGPPMEFAEAERLYPEFSSLMAGPFNQDWRCESETAEEIWQRELFDLSVEEMEEFLAELKAIAARLTTSDEVSRLLAKAGSGFVPEVDAGEDAAGWLRSLTVRLEAAIDQQRVRAADPDEVPLEQPARPRNEATP